MAGARETYDAMAADYVAHEGNPWNALYEQPGVRALLPPLAGRRVLDAGCGAGGPAAWLVEQGAEVVGVDASPEMVRLARERVPAASFAVADLAQPLRFEDELLRDRWTRGERTYDVRFWHRPLSRMFSEIAEAGFRVDVLSEPQPLPEVRERFPEAWQRLTTHPHFLFLRLVRA